MLKYLFVSEHADGSIVEQTQEDVSTVEPTRSAFYDVVNHASPVVQFSLVAGNVYTVNLISGLFSTNGISFRLHNEKQLPFTTELLYFRDVKRFIEMDSQGGTREIAEPEISYRFGYTATQPDGTTFERVIEID